MAKFDETEGRWITTKNGRHIFIRKENKTSDTGAYERDYDERDVIHYENIFKGDASKNQEDTPKKYGKDNKAIPMHRHDLISQYQEDIRDYLKDNNGKLPEKLSFGWSNSQKDAFFTALDREYKLSSKEEEYYKKLDRNYEGGLSVGDKEVISQASIRGLSSSGEEGLKKWTAVQETRKGEDPVDKQEREIAKRAEETKALNDEKKANDAATSYAERKKELVNKYRGEFQKALKKSGGKMPTRVNVDMNNKVQADAVFSAIDAEYELSPAEDKIWDMVHVTGGANPKLSLPGKSVSTLGLSNEGVSGLRKWLAVWGLKNL